MKRKVYIFLFFILQNFSFSQTQLELNQESDKSFRKADKELNLVYQKILTEYKSDVEFIKNLKASQKIWIQFRDAEIKMKFPNREEGYYGSIHPLCWNNYLEYLTRERIKTLKIWINGIEEGDLCSGTVKTK